jgi:hypothetical protein
LRKWDKSVRLRKSSQPSVIPAGVVIHQADSGEITLAGEAEVGLGNVGQQAFGAEGHVALFAKKIAISVGDGGDGTQMVGEQILQTVRAF